MEIVMVGAEKGGVGKSTCNQNLAALRASLDFRVAIYDADRQGSSKKFITRRRTQEGVAPIGLRHIEELEPDEHARIDPAAFAQDVQAFAQGFDTVFLDIGGKDTDLFREALTFADRIIVPLTPSMQDLDVVPDLLNVTDAIEDRTGRTLMLSAILNQADPRKRMTRYIVKRMEEFENTLPLLANMIAYREAYKFSYAFGRGVHELKGVKGAEFDALAANEIKDFYLEVFK